jgi:hypothetical protein
VLNELLIAERGVRKAGISMTERHPDVKAAAAVPTLIVRLGVNGDVESVQPVPSEAKPWTLRKGQHNSFPFIQPKAPLWAVSNDDKRRKRAIEKTTARSERRSALLSLADEASFDAAAFNSWPGVQFAKRLYERREQLASLRGTPGASVLELLDRFLKGCDADPQRLLWTVTDRLAVGLRQTAQDDWLRVGLALLLGRFDKGRNTWVGSGALLFEAEGTQPSIVDPGLAIDVSKALRQTDRGAPGVCGLTGEKTELISGNFPQPNLPVLGQTYLFAKNPEIPANDRYRRFAADALAVGQDTAIGLAAAVEALTADGRKGVTWRALPGEAPKQNDLLLAFVGSAPDAPIVETLAHDGAEDDFSREAPQAESAGDSVADFEKRTERVVQSIRARVGADFRKTPVQVTVLRKVDPANRKAVYAGAPTVGELYAAAIDWEAGERNVPPWLTLPVPRKGESRPLPVTPRHVAPLALIAFSKHIFVRQGTERHECVGLCAGEALAMFLDLTVTNPLSSRQRVRSFLRLLLFRRSELVTGVAHTQHTPWSWKRRSQTIKRFDHREALRTVTVLGVVLHKLGRRKETYMGDTAFKLGQLLAAADVVHAGYCADVRGGDVPPSLLGNQVFTTAQTAPVTALAMLSRRWKPYDAWAKKAARERDRTESLVNSKKKDEKQRGWDIRRAVRHAREMGPLADVLKASLDRCAVDDAFRAELLLGYLAGLPKAEKKAGSDGDQAVKVTGEEE